MSTTKYLPLKIAENKPNIKITAKRIAWSILITYFSVLILPRVEYQYYHSIVRYLKGTDKLLTYHLLCRELGLQLMANSTAVVIMFYFL